MLKRTLAAFALLTMCAAAPGARADVLWTLVETPFGDGGVAYGTFALTDTGLLSSWELTTTSSASFPGATYSSSSQASIWFVTPNEITITSDDESAALVVDFVHDLLVQNSPDPVSYIEESKTGLGSRETEFPAGYATVPEPASALVMAFPLEALAFGRRRSNGFPGNSGYSLMR
jgi:hypothetical protein